jgi:hypothetical protein
MHQPISALPPIATAKADIGKLSCPLYPRKRTCAVQTRMSAMGQKRTSKRTALASQATPSTLTKRAELQASLMLLSPWYVAPL